MQDSSGALLISTALAGARLDKCLAELAPELTRQRAQQLIKDGMVQLDGMVVTQCSTKVKAGQTLIFILPELEPAEAQAEAIALNIVYEDEHLLVIDKAAGMVVHPAAGASSGTLVNALLHHCGESLSGIGGVSRPGIVHRLDKDTSGLMLVAKHDAAHQGLAAQLQDRSLSRTYHALCWSGLQPPEGSIDAPIARSPRNRKMMAVVEGGKEAVTHYHTLKHYMLPASRKHPARILASLVECKLQTGRTHQIRVHMHHKGCALVGDPVYGAATSRRLAGIAEELPPALHDELAQFQRQALHATAIRFIHPVSREAMAFASPYPADMQRLINDGFVLL